MSAEAADVSAQVSQAPAASPHDRLKALLSAPSESPSDPSPEAREIQRERPKAASDVNQEPTEDRQVPEQSDQAESSEDVQSDDAQSEERQFSNLNELLEAAGLDSDKGFDLELPVKIDGKEGTARLRDLVKSYQLDGHINQRLEAVNNDRKAIEVERQKFQSERADKLLKLDAGVKTLERALMGEFADVNWQKLAVLQDLAAQINHEQSQHQAQQQEAQRAYLAEQKQMLETKVPEWSNATTRAKDKAEIMAVLNDSYGISKEEFEAITDHRHALVVRDAWKWQQLQKSKPATLNKVKAAPRLLKPGTQQSKDVVNRVAFQKGTDRLRQTGKLPDAVPLLRQRMFQ